MNNKVYTGRVFLLVTGASQGIGAKIAQVFGNNLDPGSSILLLARNSEKLLVTASALGASNVSVNHFSVDLSTANFNELYGKQFSYTIFISFMIILQAIFVAHSFIQFIFFLINQQLVIPSFYRIEKKSTFDMKDYSLQKLSVETLVKKLMSK